MTKKKVDLKTLPSNNLESEDKSVEIKGTVRTRKNRRSGFASGVQDITSYLYMEVLIPTIKSVISDMVTTGVDMLVHGSEGRPNRRRYGRRVDYHGGARRRHTSQRRQTSRYRGTRETMEIDDIIFDNRGDAERTLAHLLECIAMYEFASVGDLYQVVGRSATHTHENYGWTRLGNVRILRGIDGYSIDLPTPEYRR